MARKINISEVIDKAITDIMGKYLNEKNDIERVNENMLYVLWLIRENIHTKEEAFLKNLETKTRNKEEQK